MMGVLLDKILDFDNMQAAWNHTQGGERRPGSMTGVCNDFNVSGRVICVR